MSENSHTTLHEKLRRFEASRPIERASTIPAQWYRDAEIADCERRSIFAKSWQWVARAEQLKEAGAFVTADIGGEPIMVVRGKDGVLRAFSNVCRHRAAKVADAESGCAQKLRCRYHGWTYDLDGKLIGVPEFDGVADFDRAQNSLIGHTVSTWGPWVFVHLGTPTRSLFEWLEPVERLTPPGALEGLEFAGRKEYRLQCDWKVFVDNYLDGGYHVNSIHPELGGVIDYKHYRTVNEGLASVQISPLRQTPKGAGEEVSGVRKGDSAYYWWVFPNLMINIYEGVMDTNLVLPDGPERCRVLFDFYFSPAWDQKARAESMAVADRIQDQDADICEEVQRGLHSRYYDTGRFSVRRESGGFHFHRLLAGALTEGRPGAGS